MSNWRPSSFSAELNDIYFHLNDRINRIQIKDGRLPLSPFVSVAEMTTTDETLILLQLAQAGTDGIGGSTLAWAPLSMDEAKQLSDKLISLISKIEGPK